MIRRVLTAVLLLLWPSATFAILSTGDTLVVEWHIEGIPDEDIHYSRMVGNCPTYVADIHPGQSYAVTMIVENEMISENTNHVAVFRTYRVDIPYVDCVWRSEKRWQLGEGGDFPPEAFTTVTHRDPFVPNQTYYRIEVRYVAGDGNVPGSIQTWDACIWIEPLASLKLGYLEWLKGLPPYSGFEPEVRYRKSEGCGGCGRMGLPGFRVNTATMNLLIQDTDFAYDGSGPPVTCQRTWNADPSVTGMFGTGWTFTYESTLFPTPLAVNVTDGHGRTLGYPIPPSAVTTNEPEETPVYQVTNTTEYSATPELSSSWDRRYLPAKGERSWVTTTQDTARGVTIYRLHDPDKRLTWEYEHAEQYFTNFPLVRVYDWNSNALTFAYAGNGRITNMIDSAGRITHFQYSPAGFCTNMIVPTGHSASFQYNAAGDLLETRDLAGNQTLFSYDAGHFVNNMDTEGNAWAFLYSQNNYTHLSGIVDPLSRTSAYSVANYDMENRQTSITPPDGEAATYRSSDGEDIFHWDRRGYITTTAYSNGWPVLVSNNQHRVRRLVYDDHGNLLRRVDFDGATNSWAYNQLGLVTAATNALGDVWRYGYDACGNRTNRLSPLGHSTRMSYNAAGRVTALTEPGDRTTTFEYDSFGNIRKATDPGGLTISFGYDPAGIDVLAITNGRGAVWRYEYDQNRRLTRVMNPDGTERRYEYDCCARSAAVSERGATNRVERNPWQYVTKHIDPLGRVTSQAYDALNNLVALTNPAGQVVRFQYDAENQLTNRIDALGDHASWTYNELGRCTSFRPTKNTYPFWLPIWTNQPDFSMTYDPEGRVTSYGKFTYQRNKMGRVVNLATARGPTVNAGFEYDAEGRLILLRHNGVQQAAYAYNEVGELTSITDELGTTVYRNDLSGLVTNISYPGGLAVQFSYDEVGLLRSVIYPNGVTMNCFRNLRNWVTNMTWGGCSISFEYDATGNLLQETRSSGAISEYVYDLTDTMTSFTHRRPGGVLVSNTIQRDSVGFTTNAVGSGLLPDQPVFGETNLVGKYEYGLAIIARGNEFYHSDSAGNLTSITGAVNLAVTYDAENRPTLVVHNGRTNEFFYGGNGRCVRSVLNGTARRHFYDHFGNMLFETDDAGKIVNLYFYRDMQLVALRNGQGVTHFYHFNATGNTLTLTDQDAKISATYRYLPYGEVAGGYSRTENPFTFMGRDGVRDVSGGIYMTVHRFYDARVGRFFQYDPIGPVGGFHPYDFATGNPIDFSDPLGLLNKAKVIAGTVNAVIGFPLALFGAGTANPFTAISGGARYVGGLKQIVEGMNEKDTGPCSIGDVVWTTAVPSDGIRGWVESWRDPEPAPEPEPQPQVGDVYSGDTPAGAGIEPEDF
ncbi:MAG: hypothetical protein KJ626_00475 [Verrucomicrobia bacterium]|nr:hypothetical protein [Verrucomicrobiota bacterium]